MPCVEERSTQKVAVAVRAGATAARVSAMSTIATARQYAAREIKSRLPAARTQRQHADVEISRRHIGGEQAETER